MRRAMTSVAMMALGASVLFAGTTIREVRTRGVAVGSALPADLASPEGKSRWNLEGVTAGAITTTTLGRADGSVSLETRVDGGQDGARVLFSVPEGERWLFPDRDPLQMKMGAQVSLEFNETRDGLVDRLSAHISTVGIGWIHLPSGPKEVVLERVLVLRQRAGERLMRPDVLIHRWVSPLEGVVAEISGPASSDGRARLAVEEIKILDSVVTGAADLKVYSDQLYRATLLDIKYGYDKGPGTTVASLVPNPGISNVCDLVNLSTWDFTGVNSGTQTASTQVASVAAESCNTARCGYQGYPPSGTLQTPILERLDRNLTGTLRRDNQVVQWEDRATDRTLWLRAGTQNENKTGIFGSGESRFCFVDEASKPREEVPLWRMSHNDAAGWYAQAGDTWGSTPVVSKNCSINTGKTCTQDSDCLAGEGTCVCPPGVTCGCQETFYTLVCGTSQPLTPNPLYGRSCSASGQTYRGGQFGKIVKGGVVITPSGHTLNALVVRNSTEFCVYSDSACTGFVNDRVRTIVYYWQVPYLGSVALVRNNTNRVDYATGETGETPCLNFTAVGFTDMGYGLYPPVSITAGATTETTLQLSWNPGNDVHRISGYKLYWDTDPGASSSYAFNSVANPGQVSIVGTTATISGLNPGTPYYVTVTSLSNFTDPSSSVSTQYESIRYPTIVSGDPSFSYPVEVTATTTGGTCIPQLAVTGVTVDKAGSNVHVCWNATTDTCAVGYDVLASDDVTSDASWLVAGQVGLATCWDGNPAQQYLLVRARGTGGNGPWGHYNH